MNSYQLPQQTAPQVNKGSNKRKRKIILFLVFAILTLAIAVTWALNDMGWFPGPWAKLAFVFFTWATLTTVLYTVFFGRRD